MSNVSVKCLPYVMYVMTYRKNILDVLRQVAKIQIPLNLRVCIFVLINLRVNVTYEVISMNR